MRGEYIITDAEGNEFVVPNTVIAEGQLKLWHALFNNDDLTNLTFEFGAFAEVPAYAANYAAQYTSEPTIGTNGYARTVQNPTGWTIAAVNSQVYA